MKNKTLTETLRMCFDHIDEIEDWCGEEDLRNNLVDTVVEVLATHFSVLRLDLDVGAVSIKSDNIPYNTSIFINDAPVSVEKIEWNLDAMDLSGRLRLTF